MPTATLTAQIRLNDAGNPAVELYFSDGPPLAGLKLIGFAIWQRRGSGGARQGSPRVNPA
ncbi:MAG: hypothetical protein U0Q11_04610 [Vicinamibacterales bacterium]